MSAKNSNALLRRHVHGADLHSMQTSSSARFYYHADGLGSVTNLTNASGAKQWTYAWEPFSTKRTETKNSSSAPTNVMRFAGEYLDTATSLYHLRARQYDAGTGRFLATSVGTLGTAGASMVCTIPTIATMGGATPICAAGVAAAGAGATYLGGHVADRTWALGTRIGERLYEVFG